MDRWEKIGIYLSKKIAEMDGWMMVDHVSWESIEFFVGKNDGIHGDRMGHHRWNMDGKMETKKGWNTRELVETDRFSMSRVGRVGRVGPRHSPVGGFRHQLAVFEDSIN